VVLQTKCVNDYDLKL